MDICVLKYWLEVIAAILAFAAAVWWFAAAWAGRGSFMNTPIGHIDRIQWRQALRNAIAASCAGLAAIIQLYVIWQMPVCRAFG